MSLDSESLDRRELFETWHSDVRGPACSLRRRADGNYLDHDTQNSWAAYDAGLFRGEKIASAATAAARAEAERVTRERDEARADYKALSESFVHREGAFHDAVEALPTGFEMDGGQSLAERVRELGDALATENAVRRATTDLLLNPPWKVQSKPFGDMVPNLGELPGSEKIGCATPTPTATERARERVVEAAMANHRDMLKMGCARAGCVDRFEEAEWDACSALAALAPQPKGAGALERAIALLKECGDGPHANELRALLAQARAEAGK
jgi:hypothetical protein